jgi:REP element-mobilizing transposase RayT
VGTAHGQSNQPIPTLKGSNTKEPPTAQTLVSLLVHVIFSTRNRQSLITPEVEPQLFAYIGGILKNNASRLIDAGGTADHVHLIISQSKNISLSSLMKDMKKDSSVWIKTKSATFRDFDWQDGYGVFRLVRLICPF